MLKNQPTPDENATNTAKNILSGGFFGQVNTARDFNDLCRTTAKKYGYSDVGVGFYNSALTSDLAFDGRLACISQRVHEHKLAGWEFNYKIYSPGDIYAEFETISLAIELAKKSGLTGTHLVASLNNRMAVGRILRQYIGLDTVQLQMMMNLLDNKNHQTPEAFIEKAGDIIGSIDGAVDKFYQLWMARTFKELPLEVSAIHEVKRLERLALAIQKHLKVTVNFAFLMMHGAGKFMDNVFEICDQNGVVICTGGRSHSAVISNSAPDFVEATVHHALRDNFAANHQNQSAVDICVAAFHESALDEAMKFAAKMRAEGVSVDVDLANFRADLQAQYYKKRRAPFVVFIESRNYEEEVYRLHEVATGKDAILSLERIASHVLDYRNAKEGSDDFLFTID